MKSHPFAHFCTITRHRHQVIRNAWHLGIFFHALKHDLTKYGYTEFHLSARYYAGDHSPVYEERLRNDYFSFTCQHHTKRNPHHWEYWTDYFRGRVLARAIPWKYAMEYVADMLSASKTYDPKHFRPETTYEYFNSRADTYFMHPVTREFIKKCLAIYRDEGFTGLKKKKTKALYASMLEGHPLTYCYLTPLSKGDMPQLKENEK